METTYQEKFESLLTMFEASLERRDRPEELELRDSITEQVSHLPRMNGHKVWCNCGACKKVRGLKKKPKQFLLRITQDQFNRFSKLGRQEAIRILDEATR